MDSYFKPWKRKIGLLTLAMACVFAAGWVRSQTTVDLMYLDFPNSNFVFISGSGSFLIVRDTRFTWADPAVVTKMSVILVPVDYSYFNVRGYRRGWAATNVGVYSSVEDALMNGTPTAMTPYGYVVIPLTLLSAFLLLSKPRKSTQMKLTEPIPEKLM
jgi:hypothetical protein